MTTEFRDNKNLLESYQSGLRGIKKNPSVGEKGQQFAENQLGAGNSRIQFHSVETLQKPMQGEKKVL